MKPGKPTSESKSYRPIYLLPVMSNHKKTNEGS